MKLAIIALLFVATLCILAQAKIDPRFEGMEESIIALRKMTKYKLFKAMRKLEEEFKQPVNKFYEEYEVVVRQPPARYQ
jgi:hypothetical protein